MSMSQKVSPHIVLAPGGAIPVIDENQELLERIKDAPELDPLELFLLENFYHVYQTNTFLADHLTLIREAKMLRQFLPNVDWGDIWEDVSGGYDNTPEDNQEKLLTYKRMLNLKEELNLNFLVYKGDASKGKRRSKGAETYADYEIKCIPSLFPGLGLLIETLHGDDPHIIGVCPNIES